MKIEVEWGLKWDSHIEIHTCDEMGSLDWTKSQKLIMTLNSDKDSGEEKSIIWSLGIRALSEKDNQKLFTFQKLRSQNLNF